MFKTKFISYSSKIKEIDCLYYKFLRLMNKNNIINAIFSKKFDIINKN
jgi:hypothetical protein